MGASRHCGDCSVIDEHAESPGRGGFELPLVVRTALGWLTLNDPAQISLRPRRKSTDLVARGEMPAMP